MKKVIGKLAVGRLPNSTYFRDFKIEQYKVSHKRKLTIQLLSITG